ncbi:MAG: tyrosine-protein phosphatase [Anaerolineae bacterium]
MAALVNLSTIVRVFFSRRVRVETPDPLGLVVEPSLDLTASRQQDDSILIRWTFPADSVAIYASSDPNQQGARLREVSGSQQALISDLDRRVRYYFTLLVHHNGSPTRRVVAERILPLELAPNFRDIGGYPAADGKHTRWGKLFRTGPFSSLTDFDREYLLQLHFKLVCDLRSETEVEQMPDTLPDSASEYWWHPVFSHKESTAGVRRFLLSVNNIDKLNSALQESYKQDMIDKKGAIFGTTLRRILAADTLPMSIHCTAGKDRTGVTVALLFAALGVPDEVIIADYSLSNLFNYYFRAALKDNSRGLRILRLTQDSLMPLLLAHPDTMRGTLAHIRTTYGSYANYLNDQCGVDSAMIQQLRTLLLE